MKKLFYVVVVALGLLFVACGPSIYEAERTRLLENKRSVQLAMDAFIEDKSAENFLTIYKALDGLDSNLSLSDLSSKESDAYLALCDEMSSLQKQMRADLDKYIPEVGETIVSKNDELIEKGSQKFAARLKKGDKICYSYSTSDPVNLNIYNIDSRKCVKSYTSKISISDSLTIANTAVYLFELVNPKSPQYVSYDIVRYCKSVKDFWHDYKVVAKEVPARKDEFMAYARNEYKVSNLFDEPRKLTLRGEWKAAWSGHKRTIVALNIPANSVNVAYQLRIDTSDRKQKQDGEFFNNMSQKCEKVKIMGVTVKEKTESHTNMLRDILKGLQTPDTEEEAYCSMYVFYNEAHAKAFADNPETKVKNYDANRSLIGTQSCNGSLPVVGKNNVYLCFENDQFRGSVYLFLEAVATATETNYYKTIYQ